MYLEYLNNHPDKKLSYHVQGRNGYWGIDEYLNTDGEMYSGCVRMVDSFRTKKQAKTVCAELQQLASTINALRGV
jgi:hypothetical protein